MLIAPNTPNTSAPKPRTAEARRAVGRLAERMIELLSRPKRSDLSPAISEGMNRAQRRQRLSSVRSWRKRSFDSHEYPINCDFHFAGGELEGLPKGSRYVMGDADAVWPIDFAAAFEDDDGYFELTRLATVAPEDAHDFVDVDTSKLIM